MSKDNPKILSSSSCLRLEKVDSRVVEKENVIVTLT